MLVKVFIEQSIFRQKLGFDLLKIKFFSCFFDGSRNKIDKWPGNYEKMYVFAILWKIQDNDMHHSQLKINSKKEIKIWNSNIQLCGWKNHLKIFSKGFMVLFLLQIVECSLKRYIFPSKIHFESWICSNWINLRDKRWSRNWENAKMRLKLNSIHKEFWDNFTKI